MNPAIAAQLIASCEALQLPACARFVASLHPFPDPIAPPALPEIIAHLPPPLAAISRSAAHDLDPSACRTLLEAIEGRVAEQSFAARDLLASYFFDAFTLASLQPVARAWGPSATSWTHAVVRLDDDALWHRLAESSSSSAELVPRVEALDVAALAALCARGEATTVMTSAMRARWHQWIEILMTAHCTSRASLFAGLLARELGDVQALSRWGELVAAQSLRFPSIVAASSALSTLGPAAERVPIVDARGFQHLLRLRLACAHAQHDTIAELLAVETPRGMNEQLVVEELFVRLEAAVRLGRPVDTGILEISYELVKQRRTGWLYGRWVVLLAFASLASGDNAAMRGEIESFVQEFGGTVELYVELRRYTSSPALRDYLHARVLGDVIAHPAAVTPWLALASAIETNEAKAAQGEILQRLDQQLLRVA